MENETIIKEIGTYYFKGFYESIFNNSMDFIDEETELKEELETEFNLNENIIIEIDYINFNKYMHDVANEYLKQYINSILEVLPANIVLNNDFLFTKTDNEAIVISPKYYNYSTDNIYCNIETNYKTLEAIKNYTLSLPGAETYIPSKWSSCDGFISFIPNDINQWKQLDIKDYEENILTALLDMLLYLTDKTLFNKIELETYYNIDKMEYVEYYLYCNDETIKNQIKTEYEYLKIRS